MSGNSRQSLTREPTRTDLNAHYKDQYILAQVDPFGNEIGGVETEIATKPKPKWEI